MQLLNNFYVIMINRVLIRLKIVQIVYAYYQNGGKNLDNSGKRVILQPFLKRYRLIQLSAAFNGRGN